MNKTKVLFLLPSLSGGGAERVITDLLPHLDNDFITTKIGLLCHEGAYLDLVSKEQLLAPRNGRFLKKPQQEKHTPIWQGLVYLFKSISLIRYYLKQFSPDIVITVTESMNVMSQIYRLFPEAPHAKWILRIGNNSYKELHDAFRSKPLQWVIKRFYTRAYQKASHILAISQGIKNMMQSQFGVSENHITVIHNPLNLARINTLKQEPLPPFIKTPYLLSVGRIGDFQKRIDILIHAYHASEARQRGIPLYIIGNYAPSDLACQLIKQLHLETHVYLLGFQSNPYSLMANSLAMIHTAEWEGFACVIAEGLACGTLVISSDCDFGPREIIEHGKSGILVPINHTEKFTEEINTIIRHPERRTSYAEKALIRAKQFELSQTLKHYKELIRNHVKH